MPAWLARSSAVTLENHVDVDQIGSFVASIDRAQSSRPECVAPAPGPGFPTRTMSSATPTIPHTGKPARLCSVLHAELSSQGLLRAPLSGAVVNTCGGCCGQNDQFPPANLSDGCDGVDRPSPRRRCQRNLQGWRREPRGGEMSNAAVIGLDSKKTCSRCTTPMPRGAACCVGGFAEPRSSRSLLVFGERSSALKHARAASRGARAAASRP